MRTRPPSLNRTLTATAAAVLAISLLLVLIPRPPETGAHVRTRAGTVTQKITYAYGRPVKYQHCVREGDLYPSGYGCLQWVTKTRMENCSGPGPGCHVINKYTRLTCSGYWVGTACRAPVSHQHPTTTTRPPTTTTTTRPPPVTTTTRKPVTTTTRRRATTTTRRPVTTTTRRRATTTTRTNPRRTTTTRPPTTRAPRPRPVTTTTTRRPTTTTTRPIPITTTTRSAPTTTTRPPQPIWCLPPSDQDLKGVRDRFGWGAVLERPQGLPRGVAGGDEIPVGGGPDRLFVTSNKLVESAAAEPKMWPLVPQGVEVVSGGTVGNLPASVSCRWELRSVRSDWRELLVWRWSDRSQMRQAAPELVEQWERMSQSQRRVVQARHRSAGVADPPEVVCKPGQTEETDCTFFVSHPSVWEWKLWAIFRTTSGKTPQQETLLVWNGVSRLQRLVDYTSSTAKVCTGADC